MWRDVQKKQTFCYHKEQIKNVTCYQTHCISTKTSSYFLFSLNCMALCDKKKRFRFFSCRHQGSDHDSRVLTTSSLLPALETSFNPAKPRFVFADQAYSASNVIFVPFRESQLDSATKKKYNLSHQKTRLCIEHSFGMIKTR